MQNKGAEPGWVS